MSVRRERREGVAQDPRFLLNRLDDDAVRQQSERRERGGTAERVSCECAVKEMAYSS